MQTATWALSFVVLMTTVVGSAHSNAPEGSVAAPGAKLEKLSSDYSFTEGPASDAAGNVFFTDQPNDRILKWSVDGKITTFLEPAGRSNGLCFDRSGSLWACADGMTIDNEGNVYLTTHHSLIS